MSEPRILTQDEAFELLAHFVATAELHTTEGGYYSDKRILEGCQSLIDAMARASEAAGEAWLEDFNSDISTAIASRNSDPNAYAEFLQDAAGRIVKEIKRRREEIE